MARLAKLKSSITKVEFLDTIACVCYYSPGIFLTILESNGWTQDILKLWFESVPLLKRRKDKKLSILALSSLLTLEASQLPQLVTGCLPAAVEHASTLCQQLHEMGDKKEDSDEEESDEDDDGI